ncbi:hypothetical protein [Paraburkholderia azotifigens]|uniref:UvrABC system protein A n=1 Tax=Paraburkholderia azotifigens TaxID=2057004 RepID=A0A5C6V5X1_9BURK|nr:hypothetical protein [Paraburkholderia azotifigens]TXC79105.1 hypothetical protein FRZ40_32300 [Paraburkholderia azotifigens]
MKLARAIEVVGATTNNLRDVDVHLPENSITAVVGVSGSGKSSLVDKTIAAVGSARTRRFLDIPAPGASEDVPAFVGATPPTVVVAQRAFLASTRNTVATSTALMRVLRRLFSRFSAPFAADVGEPAPVATAEIVAEWLIRYMSGKAIVWVVPAYQIRTDGLDEVRNLASAGLGDVVIYSETDKGKKAETGTTYSTARFKGLRCDVRHTIEAKVGEVSLSEKSRRQLLDILRKAWEISADGVFIELPASDEPALSRSYTHGLELRKHRVHPSSRRVFRKADPHLFSFNAPTHEDSGACPSCEGLGVSADVQEELLVAHPERSMRSGSLALWTDKNYRYVNIQHSTIEGLRGRDGFDPDVPWNRLPLSARRLILEGSADPVIDLDPKTKRKTSAPHPFSGFRAAILERIGRQSASADALKRFVSTGRCPMCEGTRWCAETRALRVGGRSIDEVLSVSFSQLADFADAWKAVAVKEASSASAAREIESLIQNVAHIARSFSNVGLGHLSGGRSLLEVSDGEARRIRLAGVLNSRLSGLLLVLDEPGRGLHEADLDNLAIAISDVAKSHTVLMSEHRARLVQNADQVIQLGPGGGPEGGQVIAHSLSNWTFPVPGRDLSGAYKRKPQFLEIAGASVNTVQSQTVRIPLGTLTCIAGVSGSGKSSFVRGALVPALIEALPSGRVEIEDFRVVRGKWKSCKGADNISALYALDQGSPSSQPRSLVATYLGFADALRRELASTDAAHTLKLQATDFGTNAGRGRCQACMGLGTSSDGEACTVCGGRRFGHDALSVRVGGLNIAEWLDLPLSSLRGAPFPWVADKLIDSLLELGIGHLSLGRSLNTLSGGEFQRLRLSRAIAVEGCSGALFVLDEPGAGLHPQDVEHLYRALRHIVSDGKNTVVAVEHDPYLLSQCDYLVEFGPAGGPDGGKVIAEGLPSEIRGAKTPTGRALKSPARVTKKGKKTAVKSEPERPGSLEEALAARQEIRQIMGDDVSPPDEGKALQPGAIFHRSARDVRPLELGDLDRAVVQFAIEAMPPVELALRRLLDAWERHPAASLYVNPLLDAVSVWGTTIPAAVIKQSRSDAIAMGLDDFTLGQKSALLLRVSGRRLRPTEASPDGRVLALRDAWALGSGFVDLLDDSGQSIASATDRLVDLSLGIAGPRRHRVDSFVRSSSLGRCPMCRGGRSVRDVDEKRIVCNTKSSIFADDFLAPVIAKQLKGFRRSELIPFFRRMADEGIWRDVSWGQLTPEEKAVVLWGYWVRPGLGTFIKHGKGADGSEVNHWLRWDGLADQLDSRLMASASGGGERTCPMCNGTGLSAKARLLMLAGRSWQAWMEDGTIRELVSALKAIKPVNTRHAMEHGRILHCLSSFKPSDLRLNEAVESKQREAALSAVAKAFTGMAAYCF